MMLTLYRYMIDNNMKKLKDVPYPYQQMLMEEGYTLEEETNDQSPTE